jgi:hypothetical protein
MYRQLSSPDILNTARPVQKPTGFLNKSVIYEKTEKPAGTGKIVVLRTVLTHENFVFLLCFFCLIAGKHLLG